MSPNAINKILAIINPTQDNKKLINRLCRIAQVEQASVEAYCCMYSGAKTHDLPSLMAAETRRFELWMDEIVAPVRAAGIKVDVKIEWNEEWQSAVEQACADTDCDLIIRENIHTGTLKDSNRKIIRSSRVPVLFVSSETPVQSGNILAALKLYHPDEAHARLNDSILRFARAIQQISPDIIIHAGTCNSGWEDILNPSDISRKTGLDRGQCHFEQDDPDKGIATIAEKINAEMILIGAVPPESLKGRLLGTTAEKLLIHSNCDVIVVS